MDQRQKLAYLDAMGITAWQAREVLPGAMPSVVYVEPDVETPPTVNDEAFVEEGESPTKVSVVARKIQSDIGAVVPELEAEPPVDEKAKEPVEAPVEFAIGFLQIPNLLLLTELSEKQAPDFTQAETQLLQDVIFALAGEQALHGLQRTVFNWPTVGGKNLPQGMTTASEYVNSAILARYERSRFEHIVLMGDLTRKLFNWQGQSFEPGYHQLNDGMQIASSVSAAQCFTGRDHKRTLWEHIKPFRKTLLAT